MKMSDLSEYNFHMNEIKKLAEETKELNRKVINQEDILRLAIQDRILGEINTEELEKIIKESDDVTNKCCSARMDLYRWSKILSGIEDELKHIISDTGYSTAEMDSEINVAKLFSDVEKLKKRAATGVWIPTESGCSCSECHFEIGAEDAASLYSCPNCHALMGEQEYTVKEDE